MRGGEGVVMTYSGHAPVYLKEGWRGGRGAEGVRGGERGRGDMDLGR